MLRVFIANKEAVQMLGAENIKLPIFTSAEWTIMENMTKILKPIYNATIFLQMFFSPYIFNRFYKRRTTSVGYIIPLLKAIEHDLIVQPVASEFPRVREAIFNGMKRRMEGFFVIVFNIYSEYRLGRVKFDYSDNVKPVFQDDFVRIRQTFAI